jgi:phosphoglycolate phosphatase-like HAD superfamily hydrolase
MKKLILFDIDGTILNVKHNVTFKLVQNIIKELYNMEITREVLPSFDGMTDLSIIRSISDNVGADFNKIKKNVKLIFSTALRHYTPYMKKDNIELLEGVYKLIERMHKDSDYELGLITGNFKENAYLKLRAYDLDKFFPIGAFGNDEEDRNLLPLLAIDRANSYHKKNDFNQSNTVIIGDTARDIECAKVNNIPVIAVATGRTDYEQLKQLSPDLVFKSLEDYEQVINSINNIVGKK